MVSIVATPSETHVQLSAGLTAEDSARVLDALAFVEPIYRGKAVPTGQDTIDFAQGTATTLALLNTDADTRIAGLLSELPVIDPKTAESIEQRFGKDISDLISGIRQLMRLH